MALETYLYTFREFPHEIMKTLDVWYQERILVDGAYSFVEDWDDPDYILITMDGAQWVSTIEIFYKTWLVNGQAMQIGGVGGVMTHPDYEKQGHSRRLMAQSLDVIRQQWQPAFAGLICKTALVPFYESQGWEKLDASLFFRHPNGDMALFARHCVHPMIYRFEPEAVWPEGDIDYGGLPW
ncbi:MAG: GNAT family N-acetyltransferase [Anaerolineae bacterium]